MEKLRQNTGIKINIVDKLSLFVNEYAIQKKLYKYIGLRKYVDNLNVEYYVKTINLEKAFQHTSFYKKYKEEFFNITGGKLSTYYLKFNEWKQLNHDIYNILEKTIELFFENEKAFSKSDLIYINTLYTRFKNESNKT